MLRKRIALLSVIAVSVCLQLSDAAAQDKANPQHLSATLALTGGPAAGNTVSLDFNIKQYTSPETIQKYGELLKEGGQEALVRALEKEDNGQVSPMGSVGIPIAIAVNIPRGDSRRIYIMCVRYMPFLERWYGGRSQDYPFAVFQMDIGPDGKGSGAGILAAKVSFRKSEQQYEIESLGQGMRNVKLLNVRVSD